MIGSCIIDGIDIATFGMFIVQGGSDDFLAFPDRRKPETNDWAEEDGLDVDLSECYFDARKIKVRYYISAPDPTIFKKHLKDFETLHFASGKRGIYIREFARTFSLRFLSFSDYKHRGGMVKLGKKSGYLTVEYMMDNPMQMFEGNILKPTITGRPLSYVSLNGFDLSRFGIIIQDVYSTSLRPYSAKRVLERKLRNINGLIVNDNNGKVKGNKSITLDCVMLADMLTQFYENYNALFNNLQLSKPLMLGFSAVGESLNCYYSKMSDFKKLTSFSRKIKVSFKLTLIETNLTGRGKKRK